MTDGTFVEIASGYIEYYIPDAAGDYKVTAIASDIETGENAERALTIRVGSMAAMAVPDRYAYTISQSSSVSMKIAGKIEASETARIWIDGDDTMIKSFNADDGGTVIIAGDEIRIADAAGRTRSLGKVRDFSGITDDAFALKDDYELYREVFGEPRRSGGNYTFMITKNDVTTELLVNMRTGFPSRNWCRDDVSGETIETNYSYQEVDGYVFPEGITQTITIPLGEDTVVSNYSIKVSDVVLDEEPPLPGEPAVGDVVVSETAGEEN